MKTLCILIVLSFVMGLCGCRTKPKVTHEHHESVNTRTTESEKIVVE